MYFPRPAVRLLVSVPGWQRASAERLTSLATDVGMSDTVQPGARGSQERRRFVARLGAHVARQLAHAVSTRLAVRGRLGSAPDHIEIAFPWRRRGTAEAFARETAGLLHDLLLTRRKWTSLLEDAAARVRSADPGSAPELPKPHVPVVAVTGTNGKTTTVRLLAHVLGGAGWSVAYSTTDGVYHDGVLVEEGDYAGPSGAGIALGQPGIDAVVLETARGGILLSGLGTPYNDVSVVTNVSRDHLGLHGIETLDQLAEVKGTITRVTKPEGWAVLNADDPRVLNMRRRSPARPFVFTLDPRHPAVRDALAEGGRAVSVLDGKVVVFDRRDRLTTVAPIEEVPSTLAGIAQHSVRNVLAVTAAALGVGVDAEQVAAGLRSFVSDAETNPGRSNVYLLDERIVVVDYAHNEDGIESLTAILRAFRAPGREVWLAFGTAGDRSDEILHEFAFRAGRGVDHPIVAELHRYLRGRDADDLVERLRAGAIDGGARDVPAEPDEVHALERMLRSSCPGDVIGITALAQRPEVFALLERRGGLPADPATVRKLVRAARRPVKARPAGGR